jgi:hypothetical protein
MFERIFQWALRHGPRILFGAAVVILLLELLQVANLLVSNLSPGRAPYDSRLLDVLAKIWLQGLIYLVGGLSSASLPFFCALVVQRIDFAMQKGRSAAVALPPAPSWLARQGARLLLALALLYFLAAAFSLAVAVQQAIAVRQFALLQGAWLGILWSAGLLLFASLALDRLDRWLATFRPTYSD